MAVTEDDLMLLESYLDNELSAAEADDLRERLSNDEDLNARLRELREQRALRVDLFKSFEPTDTVAMRLVQSVKSGTRKADVRWRVQTAMRFVGSAAALVMLGFGAGWLARERAAPAPRPGDTVAVAQPEADRELQIVGKLPPIAQPNKVVLTDDTGKVIGVQDFSTPDKARQFIQDWDRWHSKQKQVQDGKFNRISSDY